MQREYSDDGWGARAPPPSRENNSVFGGIKYQDEEWNDSDSKISSKQSDVGRALSIRSVASTRSSRRVPVQPVRPTTTMTHPHYQSVFGGPRRDVGPDIDLMQFSQTNSSINVNRGPSTVTLMNLTPTAPPDTSLNSITGFGFLGDPNVSMSSYVGNRIEPNPAAQKIPAKVEQFLNTTHTSSVNTSSFQPFPYADRHSTTPGHGTMNSFGQLVAPLGTSTRPSTPDCAPLTSNAFGTTHGSFDTSNITATVITNNRTFSDRHVPRAPNHNEPYTVNYDSPNSSSTFTLSHGTDLNKTASPQFSAKVGHIVFPHNDVRPSAPNVSSESIEPFARVGLRQSPSITPAKPSLGACGSFPGEPGGFGVGQGTRSAGYDKRVMSETRRGPSTFVPPEDNTEQLFKKNEGGAGEMFVDFFNMDVAITRSGMENSTRVQKTSPKSTFDMVHLTHQIRQNIERCEYRHPTPVQRSAIPYIADGDDVLACALTGCGKTAAYLLPIISRLLQTGDLADAQDPACCPRCIILAPTRELVVQIFNEGRKFAHGTPALQLKAIYGGTSVEFQKREVSRGVSILVATTGRLKHFIQDGIVSLEKIKILVLDEADRMLDMGFLTDIQFIADHHSLPPSKERQTLMFSATFPTEVQSIAAQLMRPNYTMVTVDKVGIANRCVTQEVIQCLPSDKKDKLLEILGVKNYIVDEDSFVFKKKTLIFVKTRVFADTLGALLCEATIPCTTIHSDRMQCQRSEALRDFEYGRKAVLIATGVAERGLDIKGVDLVINYDLPTDIDTYIHRIGRTGRIGYPGKAVSFFSDENIGLAPELVRVLKEVGQAVPNFLAAHCSGGAMSSTTSFVKSEPASGNDLW